MGNIFLARHETINYFKSKCIKISVFWELLKYQLDMHLLGVFQFDYNQSYLCWHTIFIAMHVLRETGRNGRMDSVDDQI
jgi:hypothetical protein